MGKIDLERLLELLTEKAGLPSPKTIITAKVYLNHTFPDLQSRQAFLGAMVDSMCKEFDIDRNKLLDNWKEL